MGRPLPETVWVDPAYVLQQLGGFADAAQLRHHCSRKAMARAVREGRIASVSKGRYAVPGLDAAWREALRLHGVVSGRSAAQFWELDLKLAPGVEVPPVVTVPRKRKVSRERREGVEVKWRDLPADAVLEQKVSWAPQARGRVTTLVRTVIDCCIDLEPAAALCVVDSALRRGVSRASLFATAERLSRQARPRVEEVLRRGDRRAATAFESCLRDITSRVPDLKAVPQVQIGEHRVDLADDVLRIVIEAESYAFHGSKEMFRLDCRRYTELVIGDWMVLRFVWEDVILKPEWVLAELERAIALRRQHLRAS